MGPYGSIRAHVGPYGPTGPGRAVPGQAGLCPAGPGRAGHMNPNGRWAPRQRRNCHILEMAHANCLMLKAPIIEGS